MSRITVIGATGHIGTYLVPRLVIDGHEVIAVSRGAASPYRRDPAWRFARQVTLDRSAAERDGAFGASIAALGSDIVIDLICFDPPSSAHLADALRGRVEQLIHIGTIWTHGPASVVPTPEDVVKFPFGDYGTKKAEIERDLLRRHRMEGFPVTIIHPGHIVGEGWVPLNPHGNFRPQTYDAIAAGETLALANFGLETVHHVHADDVAQIIVRALANPAAIGQSFHAVSDAALTMRGFAEGMYRWFGHEPKLTFLPFDEWARGQEAADAETTWNHIARSPNCSILKGRTLLGYAPRYGSLEAVQESVRHLIATGQVRASATMA